MSRCDQKIIMWVEFLTLVHAGLTAHLTRVWSQFSRLHSWIRTRTVRHYNSRRRDVQLINPWVSGQTSLHYADTGLELCSFQQITTMTDDHKQEYICISGSQHSSLMRNVKVQLWLEYTENTQNKPASRPNWHPHKGRNKGMYLWASGCGSVRSVHW